MVGPKLDLLALALVGIGEFEGGQVYVATR